MSHDWKPGDVAIATVKGRPNVKVVAGWSKYDPQLRWCELSPRWADGDDDGCWFFARDVTDARPLLVIDPQDREQAENLADALVAVGAHHGGCGWDLVQGALRNLLTPPKPDEPTGLGAVVEDAEGRRWVRTADTDCTDPWELADNFQSNEYGEIAAVRVLSEGVQP